MSISKVGYYLLVLICCLFIIITLCQYKRIYIIPEQLVVTQLDTPYQLNVEKVFKENNPVIINNFINKSINNSINKSITITSLNTRNVYKVSNQCFLLNTLKLDNNINSLVELHDKDQGGVIIFDSPFDIVDDNLKSALNNIKLPLEIFKNVNISLLPNGFNRGLAKTYSNQNVYIADSGELRFQIFFPKYNKDFISNKTNLELHNKFGFQKWTINEKNTNKPKYIEVIIRSNQAIIIPYNCIYDYHVISKCRLLNIRSVDLIGTFILKMEKLKYNYS